MFSFMKIATFAALAFGTIASAIPAPAPAPAPAAEAGELSARAGQDLTTILTNLNSALQGPANTLNSMTASTATTDNVNAPVQQMKTLIQNATTAANSSSGLGSGNILLLISVTIQIVISSCGKAYSASGSSVDILVILQILDPILAALVSLVLKLVAGVLTVVIGLLVGLLGTVVNLLVSLKFTVLAKVLLIL
ncbi:hypothetical protein PENSPDRAFT_649487 [Peniophora sp. CONT]|nr:hypothetical protein PENSPDRAFT_649487 [Peniophora sp. CONT]